MISKMQGGDQRPDQCAELWSAYLYPLMSMDAVDKGFKGSAHRFITPVRAEEQGHAEKLAGYLQSQNAKVVLAPIAAVQTEWPSVVAMFEDTLAHEQKVTAMIHDLCKLAAAEQDFATANMLQWFVNEQVEEEDGRPAVFSKASKPSEGEGGRLHARPETRRTLNSRTFSLSRAQSRTQFELCEARKRRTKVQRLLRRTDLCRCGALFSGCRRRPPPMETAPAQEARSAAPDGGTPRKTGLRRKATPSRNAATCPANACLC